MARREGREREERPVKPQAPPQCLPPETLNVHSLLWANGWSEGRRHIIFLSKDSFTLEINSWHQENDCIITQQLCYLAISARLSPKDRMKGATEKSHTPFYPSLTLEIKTEYTNTFQESY